MTDLRPCHLRAPTEDGAALIDPPVATIGKLIGQCRGTITNSRYDLHGVRLADLALTARSEAYHSALYHSSEYVDCGFVPSLTSQRRFILAGHQPELFHPGVWFKNYLLSSLAAQEEAIPINLIVDTDVVHSTSIAVPKAGLPSLPVEHLAFDAPGDAVAYEERPILDIDLFHRFDDQVRLWLETSENKWPERSLLLATPLWNAARTAESRLKRPLLGTVLAEARHAVESRTGVRTLEVPLSLLCRGQSFRRFLVHLLAELPRLWSIYNEALYAYRLANHIRSETHPVPRLHEQDEWFETPLHLWTTTDPRRRRAFVRQVDAGLEISDFGRSRLRLDVTSDTSPDRAIQQLDAAEKTGLKIRPRALITTMYARLVLSDLFIHGIGGAKYDELTDEIIRRFFGIEPPAYLTATATFRLPIDRPQVTIEDVREVTQRIRDGRYRPESFVGDPLLAHEPQIAQQLSSLAAEKRDYVRSHALRRGSEEVFAGLDRLNRAMHELLCPVEEHLRREHARFIEEARRARVLGSREFSFVLFPEEYLVPRLLALAQVPA
jgi:hypothetical protein